MPVHPYIPFANCAEVLMQGVLASQTVMLTNGVQKASPFGGSDLTDIATIFNNWYHDFLRGLLSNSIVFATIKVTDLTTESSPVVIMDVTAPQAGAVGTGPVVNNTALVVSFSTSSRGRSYRGRNYIPGVPTADLSTYTAFDATAAAAFSAAYVLLGSALGSAGFNHVVLSRRNLGAWRSVGVATRINGYTAKLPIGTQRRRVTGHGI